MNPLIQVRILASQPLEIRPVTSAALGLLPPESASGSPSPIQLGLVSKSPLSATSVAEPFTSWRRTGGLFTCQFRNLWPLIFRKLWPVARAGPSGAGYTSSSKIRSARFNHEELVGVEWRLKRGRFISQVRIRSVLAGARSSIPGHCLRRRAQLFRTVACGAWGVRMLLSGATLRRSCT